VDGQSAAGRADLQPGDGAELFDDAGEHGPSVAARPWPFAKANQGKQASNGRRVLRWMMNSNAPV